MPRRKKNEGASSFIKAALAVVRAAPTAPANTHTHARTHAPRDGGMRKKVQETNNQAHTSKFGGFIFPGTLIGDCTFHSFPCGFLPRRVGA